MERVMGRWEGPVPFSTPHRAVRDLLGWRSIIHPSDCLDPRCPVYEAIAMCRVDRDPPKGKGLFDLYLRKDGSVAAIQGELTTAPDRTTVYREKTKGPEEMTS